MTTETGEPIEAVIISGPRRGEIVQLQEDAVPEVSDEEIKLLKRGLDLIEAFIDRLEDEMTAAIQTLRAPGGRIEKSRPARACSPRTLRFERGRLR